MDEYVVCINKGVLLSHKKNNNAICSYMDATRDPHTKWSRSDKDKYHMISLLLKNKNLQMNLPTKPKQS